MIALLVIAAMAAFLAVLLRPAIGAYLLLLATPLVAGLGRGDIPLRPHEALLGLVLSALGVRAVLLMLSRRYEPPRFDQIDGALLLLVLTSSLVPVLWLVVRDLPLSQDDLLYATVMIKYYLIYRLFRGTIVTAAQAMTCLWAALSASVIEGALAILQVLHLTGGLLDPYYSADSNAGMEALSATANRGSSTLGSTFSTADVMIMSLILALTLTRVRPDRRNLLFGVALVFVAGCIAAGEFSGYLGLVVILLTFATLFGSQFRRLVPMLLVLGALLTIPLRSVLEARLNAFSSVHGIPQSWQGRLLNLQHFFLPKLLDGANWLLGVQPAARVPAPERWRDFVYIESGYVWLLWTGGIPLLLAFLYFVGTALPRLRRIAAQRVDAVGAAASAGYCYLLTLLVLMLFDPHFTVRGTADLLFALLALSGVPQPTGSAPRSRVTVQRHALSPSPPSGVRPYAAFN
ncbi:MAG: hypothetical protein ACJ8AW_32755 [Rhodopila sp.]